MQLATCLCLLAAASLQTVKDHCSKTVKWKLADMSTLTWPSEMTSHWEHHSTDSGNTRITTIWPLFAINPNSKPNPCWCVLHIMHFHLHTFAFCNCTNYYCHLSRVVGIIHGTEWHGGTEQIKPFSAFSFHFTNAVVTVNSCHLTESTSAVVK